mmetsp:Transcript_8025/g.20652  ORF Transcript_8025/g.20652 Transcript_8025/m.20652 type:complete len:267 (-) Transcript_8025:1541-2341(-)
MAAVPVVRQVLVLRRTCALRSCGCSVVRCLLLLRTLGLAQLDDVLVHLVLLAQVVGNVYKIPQTFDIVGVFRVDLLVNLEGDLVVARAAVARRDHQLPLDLGRLYLRRALEEVHRLLVHLVLHVVRAEPRDHVHVDGIVAVRLVVVVERLRLVVLLEEEVAHPREHTRVGRHARCENIEPFDRVLRRVELLLKVGDLPDDLDRVGDDRVQLLEERERLLVHPEPLAHQPEVVDRLDAVCVCAHGLLVHGLRVLELVLHEEAVALVD